uniref:(northern house mosquito) hypothetical protein n=1 Tax=Culex pipiens TaxID=7175 RepID=A0A8D8NT91_CULPI
MYRICSKYSIQCTEHIISCTFFFAIPKNHFLIGFLIETFVCPLEFCVRVFSEIKFPKGFLKVLLFVLSAEKYCYLLLFLLMISKPFRYHRITGKVRISKRIRFRHLRNMYANSVVIECKKFQVEIGKNVYSSLIFSNLFHNCALNFSKYIIFYNCLIFQFKIRLF